MKSLIFLLFLSLPVFGQTTNLVVTNYDVNPDCNQFLISCVSNSSEISIIATNWGNGHPVTTGMVAQLYGAGPQLQQSNDPPYLTSSYYGTHAGWPVVVTQQDIICMVTNVDATGTNIWIAIPPGVTSNDVYCIIGTNNANALQAVLNNASNIISQSVWTNVNLQFPAGYYFMCPTQVLDPNFQIPQYWGGLAYQSVNISSGGITFSGEGANASNTVIVAAGAGMEHILLEQNVYSVGNGVFDPIRGDLFSFTAPVSHYTLPDVFDNMTFDGGVLNGQQNYNYWLLYLGNGAGWDVSHHAFFDAAVTGSEDQDRLWTNCIFQHWRGEICICFTGSETNVLNDWENCQFLDGNATADNMYYGQKLNHCIFDGVGKVMEYYQNNGYTNNSIIENCLVTNISEVAGPGNVHYDIAITGAVTNHTMPSFTFVNNQFYDNVGMSIFCLNAGNNIVFSNNVFQSSNSATAIALIGAGQQPTDGSEIITMTNILVISNSFYDGISFYDQGFSCEYITIQGNTNFYCEFTGVPFCNDVLAIGNWGKQLASSYDIIGGPSTFYNYAQAFTNSGILGGSFIADISNNWLTPIPYTPDGGNYTTTNIISYGNGGYHVLQNSGADFYMDDWRPSLTPTGTAVQVFINTSGHYNVTNFWTSFVNPVAPLTLTNNDTYVFTWSGTAWTNFLTASNPTVLAVSRSFLFFK